MFVQCLYYAEQIVDRLVYDHGSIVLHHACFTYIPQAIHLKAVRLPQGKLTADGAMLQYFLGDPHCISCWVWGNSSKGPKRTELKLFLGICKLLETVIQIPTPEAIRRSVKTRIGTNELREIKDAIKSNKFWFA